MIDIERESFFEKNAFIIALFLLVVMVLWHFQGLLISPNGFMGINGDGYKNYATIEYHVKNDASYHHFEGMNYPYGDHIVFADAQPILANGIKFFSKNIIDITNQTRAIVHCFLLLSIFICYGFIYLIFRKLNTEKSLAAFAACGITCLSPQLVRWEEHYALGYLFVVPVLLYLLLLFDEKKSWKTSILIAVFTIFIAQIHLYYFGIVVLFVSSFHFFSVAPTLVGNIVKAIKHHVFHYSIQILLPILFISFYWLKIDNNITDRPSVPGGFLTYKAMWQGLFNHPNGFIFNFLQWEKPYIFSLMENVVYLGIAVFIIGLILIIKLVKNHNQKEKLIFNFFTIKIEKILLLASLPLFLLSLGLPFIILDWEKYLDLTGPLQQFRGVGRFAWVFFYLINIVAFSWFFKNNNKKWSSAILVILLLDAAYLHRLPMPILAADFFQKDFQNIDNEKNIDWKKYQAVVPLPFFQIGSEQFDIEAKGQTLPYTFSFCIEKKMPCIGAQMSRTSFELMYKIQRFATAQNDEKPIFLNDLKPNQPVLFIQNKKAFAQDTFFNTWNHFELKLLAENENLRFYESDLIWKPNPKDTILKIDEKIQNFNLKEKNIVFKGKLPNQQRKKQYFISFEWLCEKAPQPLLEYSICEIDSKNGNQLHYLHYGCRYYRTDMKNNHFVGCKIPFEIWHEDSELEIQLFYPKAVENGKLILKNFRVD